MMTLASAVSLTTTPTASTYTGQTNGHTKYKLKLEWTPGTSGNVLTVTVETRVNLAGSNGQWTQEQAWDESGTAGTYTRTLKQYQHTATGTTVVPLEIMLENLDHECRIKYSESEAGGVTKGTITAYLASKP